MFHPINFNYQKWQTKHALVPYVSRSLWTEEALRFGVYWCQTCSQLWPTTRIVLIPLLTHTQPPTVVRTSKVCWGRLFVHDTTVARATGFLLSSWFHLFRCERVSVYAEGNVEIKSFAKHSTAHNYIKLNWLTDANQLSNWFLSFSRCFVALQSPSPAVVHRMELTTISICHTLNNNVHN